MRNKKLGTLLGALPMILSATGCANTNSPSPNNQRKFHDEEEINTLTQVIHDGEKQGYACPSTGNVKVLVIPVEFTDYPADEIGMYYNSDVKNGLPVKHTGDDAGTGRGAEAARDDIRKVYFGEASETQWHSLRSYYRSSSYGQLNFDGIVAPWFKAFVDYETMEPCDAKTWADASSAATLAQNALDYYTDETMQKYLEFKDDNGNPMFSSGNDFLKYFDSNSDGVLDLVEMVYSAPFYATYYDTKKDKDVAIDNDKFWAYCGGTGSNGNIKSPRLGKWAWQSYYTMVEGGVIETDASGNDKHRSWTCKEISDGTAKVDAHTITHETGHGLGLPDYYDYDYKTSPAGTVDMMDHNIGDHNSYSKSLYGWVDPIVVTGPTQVTVRSFTDYGDCIFVPYRGYFDDNPKYGNTFHTEYIAIELYTPTGVNKADSEHRYAGKYPLCPTIPGLKVWHVDSRLGVFNYDTSLNRWQFLNYTDQIVGTSDYGAVRTATSNTGSERVDENWLLYYMNPDSDSVLNQISNDTLWQVGDGINAENGMYKNFTMNAGKAFGYKMTVDALSADSATITFYGI